MNTLSDILTHFYYSLSTDDIGPLVLLSLLFIVVMRKIDTNHENSIRVRGERMGKNYVPIKVVGKERKGN